ncbi:hypothetical protein [Planococcus sp. ISL-109]|uniref:hypothetical protein n=1 Tax=Planococcus sp. ISL-109 TaxID=2819166 RepID=UPI001BE6C716|nr:hypothetical protein [Planococcus sp. ISL-109]MBT2583327.1 hypothetical protein [Planococcus sp. ISL-109]
MEFNGITIAIIIFVLFLLITGLLVGSILMALRKSKSQKVDDVPLKQQAEFQRDVEVEELEKREKNQEDK